MIQEKILAGEEDEEASGLDLSDSDDDATWTPFKDRDAKGGPKDNNAAGLGVVNPVMGSSSSSSITTPAIRKRVHGGEGASSRPPQSVGAKRPRDVVRKPSSNSMYRVTRFVSDDQEFQPGDFIALKSDLGKEGTPIWS